MGESLSHDDAPIFLVKAFCRGMDYDIGDLNGKERERAMRVARELLNHGATASEVEACARFMRQEDWRTGIPTMTTLGGYIDKWRLKGKPTRPTVTRFKSQAEINSPYGGLVL